MISLFLSFFVMNWLYIKELKTLIQNDLISGGKTIIQSYRESYPNNQESLMKGIKALPIYSINIYNAEGKLLHENLITNNKRITINEQSLHYVLNGGVYRANTEKGPEQMVVGLPFTINGESYALFITPQFHVFFSKIAELYRTQLLIIMIAGSILIVIAARFIVRPLQLLTRAARKMAKGDFRITLRTGRKDEIGQLTSSFNEMAKELGMLEKTRQQFVSNVSHEIQSPLTSIKGFTQALIHKKMDEESRNRLLTIIAEESDRLSRLSTDLLQLSSLEYEHLTLQKREYRLDEQLRKVVIAYEPQWMSKDLRIDLELEELRIMGDEDKLVQLWNNLLSNSIKFTDPGGSIRMEAKENGDRITVSIADSGQGIPEEEWASIFKPFYKVDKSRTRKIAGSGIGLSIVRRVIDLHYGDIQVSSQPGQGTTFTISFPR
ncbi:HAMP domain-containing histidine kinase [Cohnella luojiensis]|uniref:Heme sensor protein HssS n=2 Tax=Cohnella luojiensis TaxID=652876 RepID=A0A4Y8M121_9BACL|nr:HAMP domain-containing histidine kinase [Cohnella luojiensis]